MAVFKSPPPKKKTKKKKPWKPVLDPVICLSQATLETWGRNMVDLAWEDPVPQSKVAKKIKKTVVLSFSWLCPNESMIMTIIFRFWPSVPHTRPF